MLDFIRLNEPDGENEEKGRRRRRRQKSPDSTVDSVE